MWVGTQGWEADHRAGTWVEGAAYTCVMSMSQDPGLRGRSQSRNMGWRSSLYLCDERELGPRVERQITEQEHGLKEQLRPMLWAWVGTQGWEADHRAGTWVEGAAYTCVMSVSWDPGLRGRSQSRNMGWRSSLDLCDERELGPRVERQITEQEHGLKEQLRPVWWAWVGTQGWEADHRAGTWVEGAAWTCRVW